MYSIKLKKSVFCCVVSISILVFSSVVASGSEYEEIKISPEAEALAESMGIDQIISKSIRQVKESIQNENENLFNSIVNQFPDMSDKKREKLDRIFKDYIITVMDSIDTKIAAKIYAEYVSRGLSSAELNSATDFYKSEEGKKIITVVSKAAEKLNEYMTNQVILGTKLAQKNMFVQLSEFGKSLKEEKEIN